MLILVFNFFGYRLLISGMQRKAVNQLEKRLDKKDYSRAELFSLKTTLRLPYYNASPEFERVYGSINIDGKEYEYVMRRVYQDTLEVLCLLNKVKTELEYFENAIAQSNAEGQAAIPAKKTTTFLKLSLPDFFQREPEVDPAVVASLREQYTSFVLNLTPSTFSLQEEKPPQA